MAAKILDGRAIAARWRDWAKARVEAFRARTGHVPGLATVLIGDHPASQSYVQAKQNACAAAGIRTFHYRLPAEVDQETVMKLLGTLACNPEVNGILVQLPLPSHLDEEEILSAIPLEKDVDGFHPMNLGRLGLKGRDPYFIPCTPLGILAMLQEAGIPIAGRRAVILGRSRIVGLPMALLLLRLDATVTICHSRTPDLATVTRQADLLIAAVGRPGLVRGEMVQPGAVVIDVGINRVADSQAPRGYRLVGDVAFEEVAAIASAITPVPGGVGPMTVAMLLVNTLKAAQRQLEGFASPWLEDGL
ncbi:MAG: bifunctional methylenetetrahydrofolate dehydrogenase/methenyltetrahydrofolate cyclohydrolase FolD [Anaerolineae bacterium]|nr:bifunctional methylenetetrahydrofolate dehydrogenase/methenyltetrahydrofolate cyclohydrolase FolD [Thermoflexus sp.]MDW8064061.1 bifunctional methylenetetrahydrofolate dehydrogenase/methenyltetrahydrofolate cyclohydrolase FolD [Anaerolineae bacterium]